MEIILSFPVSGGFFPGVSSESHLDRMSEVVIGLVFHTKIGKPHVKHRSFFFFFFSFSLGRNQVL